MVLTPQAAPPPCTITGRSTIRRSHSDYARRVLQGGRRGALVLQGGGGGRCCREMGRGVRLAYKLSRVRKEALMGMGLDQCQHKQDVTAEDKTHCA